MQACKRVEMCCACARYAGELVGGAQVQGKCGVQDCGRRGRNGGQMGSLVMCDEFSGRHQ